MTFFMDDLEVFEAEPVYNNKNDILLGSGESVDGNSYSFKSYMNGKARNHCRLLDGYSAGFNSQRWCIGGGSIVDYLHELPSRQLDSMTVSVNCGYYQKGSMQVLVSTDSEKWRSIGKMSATGSSVF